MNRIQMTVFRYATIAFSVSLLLVSITSAQTPEPPAQANPFGLEKAPPLPAGMTGSSSNDPRSNLPSGLFDAGHAAFGIRHLNLLTKPEAFDLGIDPNSPRVKKALVAMGIPGEAPIPAAIKMPIAGLAFANSDLAFQGKYLFMGNFYGMNIYDISDPAKAKLVTSMLCPGGQGDVSVHKNLMFMSVEMPNGRLDCGEQGFPPAMPAAGQAPGQGPPAAEKDRFRGVRIFDISDITNPKQVAAVQTCRGSHTHTLVPDPKDKDNVYIYVSGTSFVRQNEELAGCSGGPPDKDPNTALFRIDVIKVPLAAPQNAKIVSTPRIFGDPKTGAINALDDGGSHANKGRPTETNQCHDITAYPEIGLAAGACSGNGLLLDIRDPANPKRVEAVNDPNYAYWHSASFSNDGKKVVFTDEWGGGMGARCRADDPNVWGANAIFNRDGNKLTFASYYKLPAAQNESENCVAHNGSLVPVPGRDIKVQAWYQGGISVMDFTDPTKPMEIAYFDRGPIDDKMLIMGGSWSAYWYNGRIYSSEIARGLDIFELTPTKYLSQSEIDAAKAVKLAEWNVQNQQMIKWPNKLVVAKAYIDQLERSGAPADSVAAARNAIEQAEKSGLSAADRTKLSEIAAEVEKAAGEAGRTAADSARLKAVASILRSPVL
ncbi:MAG: LVIVD repeat-containing protein [Pyrinomonadaceae bacterium]